MLGVVGVFWPVHSAIRALSLVWRHGRAVHATTGISRLRQWREAVTLASLHNYSPHAYYQFRFFDPAMSPHRFVQVGEFYALQTLDNEGVDTSLLRNKLLFFDECVRAGIPTPPTVALLAGETERWVAGPSAQLPRESLFLKWQDGEQGLGYERWKYEAVDEKWMRKGVSLQHDEMLAYCRRRGTTRNLVVQYAISNHPDIDRLNSGTLCTLRVMTYRDAGAPPVLIRAVFKVARSGSEVDNLHAGGVACQVNPSTGELGKGYGNLPIDGVHTHHPDSGAAIASTRLPDYRAAIALALDAHAKLLVPWSVGWDVAITPQGPMLLEGNPMWGADLAQAPHGEPFDADFTQRLLARLTASAASPPTVP